MSDDRSDRNQTVRVRFLGHEYFIRSENPEEVLRISRFLDEQAEGLKKKTPAANTFDLSVMTAFKVAGDLFSAREELKVLKDNVEAVTEALTAKIQRKIKDIEGPASGGKE